LENWCTTMLSAARQPSKFLFDITGLEFSEVWLLLQVLPVSLRVPASTNKSSLRPWPVIQIDGSSLSSQIHSLCTLPKHGALPSSLLLKRNCVERGLAFSVLIGNNVLQEVQRLTTWWQFTLCHCCCSLKWWLNREGLHLPLSLTCHHWCPARENLYRQINHLPENLLCTKSAWKATKSETKA
jgi:hypothetical protein